MCRATYMFTVLRKHLTVTLLMHLKTFHPPSQVGSEALDSPSKARGLRRTVSVPSESQFPEFPAESTAVLGKPEHQWALGPELIVA